MIAEGAIKVLRPDPGLLSPPEAFARRYLFQKGSWWAYRDSASGKLDTMRVDSAKVSEGPLSDFSRKWYFNYKVASMHISHTSMPKMLMDGARRDISSPYICMRGENGGYLFFMGYGFERGIGRRRGMSSQGWDPEDLIYFRDSLASITVGSIVIDSLYVFDLDSAKYAIQTFPVHSRTWWAKDIGLVKYQTNRGQTFTLVDYRATSLWPLP